MALVRWFEDLRLSDVPSVGGKNASLGELIAHLAPAGVRVPGGFAVTAEGYWRFVDENGLREVIRDLLGGKASPGQPGARIRDAFLAGRFPDDLEQALRAHYRELSRRYEVEAADVAVRSSATAEDLPDASFAGQQESFLDVVGEEALLEAVRRCFASLFTDRAIAYREKNGFDHLRVALSVGVQKMVRSDLAGAGVLFTIDTETGFPHIVEIDADFGLGESVVQGVVTPDHYRVFVPLLDEARPIVEKVLGTKETKVVYAEKGTKTVPTPESERARFVLEDDDILGLARWGRAIQQHYGRPMDVEWARDGRTGELFVVQARPETVESRRGAGQLADWEMLDEATPICTGTAVGSSIAAGRARVLRALDQAGDFQRGDVLVTEMTDPDWVPVMRLAAAIVTDHGGRTSHAAIVSREFGLPAVIGTGDATDRIADGQPITVSCAEGEHGHVYAGKLRFDHHDIDLTHIPETHTKILAIAGDPDAAFRWWRAPADGVGLARMEFIVTDAIQVHPMAAAHPERVDDATRARIAELSRGYPDPATFLVDVLARGIARLAACRWPNPVIVRTSDFKTNEYADLVGGAAFEPHEENPMLGLRGASRYYNDRYRDGFALECRALRRVREELGFDNVIVMIPFCRTPAEADRVLQVMADNGLRRGRHGLKVYVMVEIPSNVLLADAFAARFDGFSIGSNDLTQLTLGIDRDSAELAPLFDDRNEAVRILIRRAIEAAHRHGIEVGLCGQAPSDHPEFARFLVQCGIDTISVNPDGLLAVRRVVAEAEKELVGGPTRG